MRYRYIPTIYYLFTFIHEAKTKGAPLTRKVSKTIKSRPTMEGAGVRHYRPVETDEAMDAVPQSGLAQLWRPIDDVRIRYQHLDAEIVL